MLIRRTPSLSPLPPHLPTGHRCWEKERKILPQLCPFGRVLCREVYKLEAASGKGELFLFLFFSLFILKYSLHQSQREILNKPRCPQVCFSKEGIYSSPLPPMSVHSRIKARESGRGSLAEGKVCLCLFARL